MYNRDLQGQQEYQMQQSQQENENSFEYYSQDDDGEEDQNDMYQQQQKQTELKRRFNLYDILKGYREEADTAPVARMLYTAYYNESIMTAQNIDPEQHMQTKVKNVEDKDKENFQGYFMIKGSFSIHLLEGDSNVINNFMLDLHKDLHKEKSIYQNINVIAFTEENKNRCFNKWYSDNIYQAGPTLSQEIEKTEKQIQDRSWEIYNQICEAGHRHSQQRQSQKQSKDKKQQKLAAEITISTDDMSLLMSKHYMSLDDYHSLYLSDIEIQLDSELQYPFQPALINILEFSTQGRLENY